jgi:transglutaminase-like putative cysteine protease
MRITSRSLMMQAIVVIGLTTAAVAARTETVVIAHRLTNTGTVDADAALLTFVAPVTNHYQYVSDPKIRPEPDQVEVDGEGQTVATFSLGPIPAGETRTAYVFIRVRPKTVGGGPLVGKPGGADPLPEEAKRAHLEGGDLLQLDRIRPLAERLSEGKTRDVDKARAFYDYMIENCVYDIDEDEDHADLVLLEKKAASCSELAYSYVALCRSVNIPARIISAYANRDGPSPSIDWRAHRWAEFWTDELGWVPVDPTNKINYNRKNYFARQDASYATILDDGMGLKDTLDPTWRVAWYYAEPAKAEIELTRSAVWTPSRDRVREAKFFDDAIDALTSPEAQVRMSSLDVWERNRESMRVMFWLEALYDSNAEIRQRAAMLLGGSKNAGVLIPLMTRLEDERDFPTVTAIIAAARTLLNSGDGEQRVAAIHELSKSRSDKAIEVLDEVWLDRDRDVRKAVAQMIYKLGDNPTVNKAYRWLIEDRDDFVRVLAVMRWGRLGSTTALKAAAKYLDSEVKWDRQEAFDVLVQHTHDDFGYDPNSNPNSNRNRAAIERFNTWLESRAAAP